MRMALCSVITLVMLGVYASPYVTNVVAKQRYPWNGKVDISYEIVGDYKLYSAEMNYNYNEMGLKVEMVDADDSFVRYIAQSISGDPSIAPGRHMIVWDLDEDGLQITKRSAKFIVSVDGPRYCIIELMKANGTQYSTNVTYTIGAPAGGWTDEYKTRKLVLRRIDPGEFVMGGLRKSKYMIGTSYVATRYIECSDNPAHNVRITKPFYMGIFEVTEKQWLNVYGNKFIGTVYYFGDTCPMHSVAYSYIRGAGDDAAWPTTDSVWTGSFFGKLRSRYSLKLDLPTEAQWEYACCAGTNAFYNGNWESDLGAIAWCVESAGSSGADVKPVGQKLANANGLYDMLGNAIEWCLDWDGALSTASVVDPVGPATGSGRILRGGNINCTAENCSVLSRGSHAVDSGGYNIGFRVCMPAQD